MKKIVLAIFTCLLLSTTVLAVNFPDVPRDGSEMSNAIYKLADAGIVGGYEDGNFRPDRHLTRAELCKIVNLIFGYNMPDTENFKDVKNTDWFSGYVLVAKKAGYIKGFEDNTFRGNTNLTREQTCIIISRTAGLYDLPTTAEIKDKVSDWAVADVKKVIANFVMPLPQDGNFRATENITRGELAMALDAFVKAPVTPSTPSIPSFPTTTTYTVKFYDAEDKVISTQTVNKGGSAIAPANPEKAADKEYTYTFKRWDKSFTNVQKSLEIRPVYDTTRIKYTLKLDYGNGTTGTNMPETVTVFYSTDLSKVLPTSDGFSNGTLLFAGWYDGETLIDSEKFSDLKGDTLTAKWVTAFTVKFYDDINGKVIKTQSVKKGGKATAPATPAKADDKEYTYTFKKWDKSFTNVESDLDVYPVYTETPIIYTITLDYGDGATGTLTPKVEVTYHQLLSNVLPTTGFKKEGYAFEGWYMGGTSIEGKKYSDIKASTLTAKWTNTYCVKFYDANDKLLKEETVKKGSSATAPATPSKAEDNEYTYTFKSWDKAFTNVQSDLEIRPVFSKTDKLYSVTLDYKTGKTEVLKFKYYEEISPRLPDSASHDTKLFAGWYVGDELIDNERYCDLASNTITAKWTDLFTVQFYDDINGNVIGKPQQVKKGENATAPASPTKEQDDEYTYTFKSWDKVFTNVQKNLDVYPVYNKTERTYPVTLDYGNGTTKNVNYTFNEALKNKIPTSVQNGEKTLLGWYVGDVKIDSQTYKDLRPEIITAKWASELVVNFYDASGEMIKTQKVKIGGKATAPASPKKASTNEYTYTFNGWDTDGDGIKDEGYKNVKSNLDVYPLYTENVRYYTLSLSYGDETEGTMPKTVKVTYNECLLDVIPTTGFSNYPFLFDGWYAGATQIDENTKYSDINSNALTVKWKADPEVLLANQTVIDEMESVLYDIEHPLADGFTKAQKRVLAPVQEAIGLAIADAKAGYIVNKQYVLDNYPTQISAASNLYHGRDKEGLGLKTDKDRQDFYFAVGDNLPSYTVTYLIEFFDVNIEEHL